MSTSLQHQIGTPVAVDEQASPVFHVISTAKKKELIERSLTGLPKEATHIHINGFPFLYVLQKLVDTYPNLKLVRVCPCQEPALGGGGLKLLEEHGIQLVIGHQTQKTWKDGEIRFPAYKENKNFFLTLSKKQRRRFKELLHYNFLCAKLARRYYCLSGEDYVPLRELAHTVTDGTETMVPSIASAAVQTVRAYLDKRATVGKIVRAQVATLTKRVEKTRQEDARRIAHANQKERPPLPKNLHPSQEEVYKVLQRLYNNNTLRQLLGSDALFDTLVYRFGLRKGRSGHVAHSLNEIAVKHRVSKQAVEQRVGRALAKLGNRLNEKP